MEHCFDCIASAGLGQQAERAGERLAISFDRGDLRLARPCVYPYTTTDRDVGADLSLLDAVARVMCTAGRARNARVMFRGKRR